MPRRRATPGTAVAGIAGAAVLLLTGCGPDGTPEIVVGGPAQAAEPVAGSSQIVLELRNTGDGDDVLVEARTPAALGLEFHRTTVEDGRASMNELTEVEVPSGGTVRFRPGGLHLMMVVPDESVALGASFDLELAFERSEPIRVEVEVVDLLDLAEATFDAPPDEQPATGPPGVPGGDT